mmetsp:Transcript_37268/g.68186  ORF Transcript_37268/g.68186 Transcript_37268/m.68186 type:complete len:329 (-) Transcript_37268:56-1042(-)
MAPKTKWFNKFFEELPRVDGKVFVITGTTSGTGFVAAWAVAKLGGEVLLLNRPSQRVTDSMAKLKTIVPDGKFVNVACDLQDFETVRKAAAEIKSKYTKLYCLSLNAGIMATPDRATKDGYDTQMQTNHLAHFLLTAELYPLLEAEARATGDARIVTHSSGGRLYTVNKGLEEKYFRKNGGNLGGDSIKLMGGACFHRYFQTKLANSVFTYGLHEKLKAKGSKVRSISSHPGASTTNLGASMKLGCFQDCLIGCLVPLVGQSSEDGTMGLLKAMVATDAQSGVLYGPANSTPSGPAVANPIEPYETDPKALEMLWKTSEEATGVKFNV